MPSRSKEHALILTIGHSNRTLRAFRDLLRAHQVERVVDVRTLPRSRHNPQFNRETLRARLRSAHIGYVHLRRLGGLRRPRRDSTNTGWQNLSFRGFADYMQGQEFEAGLKRLVTLAAEKRCALLCAEAVPWRCHRSLISDALVVRGFTVEHIFSRRRRQEHRLTGFAKISGHRLSYPLSQAAQTGLRHSGAALPAMARMERGGN